MTALHSAVGYDRDIAEALTLHIMNFIPTNVEKQKYTKNNIIIINKYYSETSEVIKTTTHVQFHLLVDDTHVATVSTARSTPNCRPKHWVYLPVRTEQDQWCAAGAQKFTPGFSSGLQT